MIGCAKTKTSDSRKKSDLSIEIYGVNVAFESRYELNCKLSHGYSTVAALIVS